MAHEVSLEEIKKVFLEAVVVEEQKSMMLSADGAKYANCCAAIYRHLCDDPGLLCGLSVEHYVKNMALYYWISVA